MEIGARNDSRNSWFHSLAKIREATGTATLFPRREGNVLSLAQGLPSSQPASHSGTGPVTHTGDMRAQVTHKHRCRRFIRAGAGLWPVWRWPQLLRTEKRSHPTETQRIGKVCSFVHSNFWKHNFIFFGCAESSREAIQTFLYWTSCLVLGT